jgi:predicted RNA binding protein YcfA (HicA-like mRNA interferase family)
MPRLRVLSGREVCKIMAEHGFEEVRRKGSHIIMQKKDGGTTITVPVPDHAELRAGTFSDADFNRRPVERPAHASTGNHP